MHTPRPPSKKKGAKNLSKTNTEEQETSASQGKYGAGGSVSGSPQTARGRGEPATWGKTQAGAPAAEQDGLAFC